MPKAKEIRLEDRLLLHDWINSLLGYEKTENLLRDFREVNEGFDAQDRSYIYHRLYSRAEKLDPDLLANLETYDDNIRQHLLSINRLREEPVTLRYFQHLALLYAEVFLDRWGRSPATLVRDIHQFAQHNMEHGPGSFDAEDLRKLAFWMATGGGKTLLMHINYLQFLHYNDVPLDNILLITPNEGLTEQHLEEMRLSGIPCERFAPSQSGLDLAARDVVRATEITKLTEEKKGGGVRVDVESFEGRNLIFVDEGHKGSAAGLDSGKEGAWLRMRRRLAEDGFTFEYSATFGQAVATSRANKESTEIAEEYGRAILFDYSYRYFHGDGFGKDFEVLNLKNQSGDEADLLLLGNLLSFYEQREFFAENHEVAKDYNLESPLWIFVGSKVQQKDKKTRSDILTVLRFLQRFLRNESGWSIQNVGKLLHGESELSDAGDRDVFEGKFKYLRERGKHAEEVFEGLLRKVFHASAGSSLRVSDLRGAEGELGLKVSGEDDYFGVVYIGDTKEFKDLVQREEPEIVVEEDAISTVSLFAGIEEDDSPVNLLIGARKFIEGWSSWRVSAMGLLNVGKSEGSQIIQLFGRGVRLKGKNTSMKRSDMLDGNHPNHIDVLETLNIFGVEAGYMAQFREYLEHEGIDPEGYDEILLPILPQEQFINDGLLVPALPDDRDFATDEHLLLEVEEGIKVNVDLSTRMEMLGMEDERAVTGSASAGSDQTIDSEYLSMLNWNAIYLDLLQHKESKGFHNLVIPPQVARLIMEHPTLYRLTASDYMVRPERFQELWQLQEVVQTILRKYVESFYKVRQQRWETDRMEVKPLSEVHENFADYTVKVKRSKRALLDKIESLIEQGKDIYETDLEQPPTVHFDRHLYQPLLVKKGDDVKSSPPALEPSERDFVCTLRDYLARTEELPNNREIFLLRNLSRGKGIGFFNTVGFYPDFILWIKEGGRQRVVFVEPHGLYHDNAPDRNDKINLYKDLGTLSQSIADRRGKDDVVLDSYIITATPPETLTDQWGEKWKGNRFTEEHILFQRDLKNKTPLLLEAP